MKTKAIIFDKDGTLIDFDAFWLTISQNAVDYLLEETNLGEEVKDDILLSFGVKNGITRIDGALCCGSFNEMSIIICDVLKKHGCKLLKKDKEILINNAYKNAINTGIIKPVCDDIYSVIKTLKELNITLAIVTTDNLDFTLKCLNELKIKEFFDFIYTADGKYPSKPDPYCINEICQNLNIKKDETVMVGDTLTDAQFAKNGGIKMIGVAKCEENKEILQKESDIVIPNISYLIDVLE